MTPRTIEEARLRASSMVDCINRSKVTRSRFVHYHHSMGRMVEAVTEGSGLAE
jgi:hypothetical protein